MSRKYTCLACNIITYDCIFFGFINTKRDKLKLFVMENGEESGYAHVSGMSEGKHFVLIIIRFVRGGK